MISSPFRQHGYALLAALLVTTTLAAGVLVHGLRVSNERTDWRTQRDTLRNLHEAKLALVAYALMEDKTPGALPCPTNNLDGKGAGINCGSPSVHGFGRLPWLFLGMSDGLGQDASCLWYGLSAGFKNDGHASKDRGSTTYPVINAGTPGALLVVQPQVSVPAVAVLVAPGRALPGQTRGTPANYQCASGNPDAFLEATNNISNADGDFRYVAGKTDAGFNDQVLAITRDDLMRPLLRRVLTHFRAANVRMELKNRISQVGPVGNLRQLRELNGNTLAFDQLLLSNSPSASGLACPYNSDEKHPPVTAKHPVSWLCFNNWYEQITYDDSGSSWSLRVALPAPSTYRCRLDGISGNLRCGHNA